MCARDTFRPTRRRPAGGTQEQPATAGIVHMTGQEGSALVVVVLLTTAMLALGAFGTRSAQTELRIAHNNLAATQALDAAEAGLNHAFSILKSDSNGFNDDLASGGTGGEFASLGSVATLEDGNRYLFRPLGGGAKDGYYVRLEGNYDETLGGNDPTTDADGKINVISRGRVRGAERVISAQVIVDGSLFGFGLFGKQYVSFGGSGALTDSWDSRVGPYATSPHGKGGNISSNGSIALQSSTVVNGDATAGIKVSLSSSAVVNGTITNNAPQVTLPLDPVPSCGPPYSSGTGISGTYTYFPTGDKAGQLIVSGGQNATLAPGTYCFSSVNFSGGSTMTVTGPTAVNLTGFGNWGGGGIANTTGTPANLQIFSSYVYSKVGVTLSGGSRAYAAVYAPGCGISVSGGGDFFGSAIGNYLEATGGSKFHYDQALGSGRGLNVRLGNWHEVRSN